MSVAVALLVDAYRELNSRRLFWVTLVISGLVILGYASIGFDSTGMSMFFGLTHIENEFFTQGSPLAKLLYRSVFSTFMVGIWLAWVATILAIISTTSIFPDFVAGGAIDLVLAKPIRRTSLFFLKYLASLLFVVLQVSVFCVGVFLCMGWRIGEWNPMIFAAIPLVTLFYSYLYCVNVLVGIITRSALTALLVTMLFWVSLFSLNAAEAIVNRVRTQAVVRAEQAISDKIRAEDEELIRKLDRWHRPVRLIQAVGPKTSDTIGLLERWFRRRDDLPLADLLTGNFTASESGGVTMRENNFERQVALRIEAEYHARSWWYLIGSSLAFEALVLGVAGFVFVRRDY